MQKQTPRYGGTHQLPPYPGKRRSRWQRLRAWFADVFGDAT